jgi:hydroxyethylthiazole kinase
MLDPRAVAADLETLRAQAPLVHNITNFVVMEPTANALLALGASPVMAHAVEEMEDITRIASALVLNIGTLSPHWIEAMHRAGSVAKARGIPVVLDPVGVGASRYRTETALALLDAASPSIVRGNASEILTLAGEEGGAKGVDSTAGSDAASGPARTLARRTGGAVSVSGATDLVTDGDTLLRILNDTPLMTRVTGMGCTASAITGAFAAVNPDPLRAAAHAMAVMAVAGERAAEGATGPGSFLPRFHDALHTLTGDDLVKRLRVG